MRRKYVDKKKKEGAYSELSSRLSFLLPLSNSLKLTLFLVVEEKAGNKSPLSRSRVVAAKEFTTPSVNLKDGVELDDGDVVRVVGGREGGGGGE
jgi:hypothetical protein